jgi:hypothetical protein
LSEATTNTTSTFAAMTWPIERRPGLWRATVVRRGVAAGHGRSELAAGRLDDVRAAVLGHDAGRLEAGHVVSDEGCHEVAGPAEGGQRMELRRHVNQPA